MELGRLTDIFNGLSSFKGSKSCTDQVRWKGQVDGVFTLKTCYRILTGRSSGTVADPWKTIWKSKAPAKVMCFIWLVLEEACLTQYNFLKKKYTTQQYLLYVWGK